MYYYYYAPSYVGGLIESIAYIGQFATEALAREYIENTRRKPITIPTTEEECQ